MKKNSQDDLLETLAHDLRTPLTIIKGHLDNLLHGLAGPLNEEQKDSLNIAVRNADFLHRLLKHTLDFSRLESGGIQPEKQPLDVAKILKEVQENFMELAEAKGIKIVLEVNPKIPSPLADEEMIMEVFNNLVSNALRFALSKIRISAQYPEAKEIQFSVEDDGPGLEPEEQSQVFEKYRQLHRRKNGSGYKGTGLGLAITKKIVELHGGQIRLESSSGSGCRFTFTLPLAS
jgi:two-component system sensor histidine kinase ChiS